MSSDGHEAPSINLKRQLPEAYRALAALTRSAGRFGGGLDELIKVRASIVNRCSYCIDTHTTRAVAEGEDPRRLHALAAWADSAFFTPRERAALAVTDAITIISDGPDLTDALAEAAAEFPEDELNRLVAAIVAINAWNRAAIASRFAASPLASV